MMSQIKRFSPPSKHFFSNFYYSFKFSGSLCVKTSIHVQTSVVPLSISCFGLQMTDTEIVLYHKLPLFSSLTYFHLGQLQANHLGYDLTVPEDPRKILIGVPKFAAGKISQKHRIGKMSFGRPGSTIGSGAPLLGDSHLLGQPERSSDKHIEPASPDHFFQRFMLAEKEKNNNRGLSCAEA